MGFAASPMLPGLAWLQGKPRHGTSSQPFGFPLTASLCAAAADGVSCRTKEEEEMESREKVRVLKRKNLQ